MVERAKFISKMREAAISETPWVHQGRAVPQGVDCVGLLLWGLRELDINYYEPPPYPMRAKWAQFVGYFREHLIEVRLPDIQPADTLIFRQSVYPCHCGIVTEIGDDPHFIHAYRPRGKVVEERYRQDWREITVTAFRVPGVE